MERMGSEAGARGLHQAEAGSFGATAAGAHEGVHGVHAVPRSPHSST